MLRKRSTSRSLRERFAEFFEQADFFVGKGVRYAAAFLIGVTTVVIIIAIVSITRSKSSGNYATVPPTFATTQSSDKGISTTIVKRTTTTESKITDSSPSSSKNTLTTKTSRRASTIATTTIYASTTTLTNSLTARSSTSALVTTTAKSTSATKPVTTTRSPGSIDMHCAFAADLENFDETRIYELDRQKKLIKDLGKRIINISPTSSAGLWTYGNVNQAKKFGDVFDDMVSNFSSFALKAEDLFCFGDERSPPAGENLIDHINQAGDRYNVANCLLFLTGSKEEKPVWKIDPIYDYNRIVIISLQGVNFTNNVVAERGVSLNVDLVHFNKSDIQAVYNEIVRGFMRN